MARHCCQFFPRGTTLVLVMSGLLYVTSGFLFFGIVANQTERLKVAFDYIVDFLFVLLPVTGWVAESWLGRYRAIVVGLVLSLVTFSNAQVAFVMLQFDWGVIPAFVHSIVGMVIGTYGAYDNAYAYYVAYDNYSLCMADINLKSTKAMVIKTRKWIMHSSTYVVLLFNVDRNDTIFMKAGQ